MLGRIQSLLTVLFSRRHFEHSMDEEMRFHLEAYADDLVASGLSRDEAVRRARLAFGSAEEAKEESRAARGLRGIDELRQDVVFGARQVMRAPGVTVAVLVSLALGIGANAAIFSVMDAVLLRTLPVHSPDRLRFFAHGPRTSTSSNYPLYERYKTLSVFDGVTAYVRQDVNLTTPDGIEQVSGQFVSGNYHALLGVPMTLGRGFSTEVDRELGSSMIAVISDGYWSRAFARDPGVLGRHLTINGTSVEIVGVTASAFHGLISGYNADVTLPISIRALGNPDYFHERDTWSSLTLVGRLANNVSDQQALAAVDASFKRFWNEPENAWARGDGSSVSFAQLLPAGQGSDVLRRQYSMPLRILMGVVGLVLIIACANVANLLLARGATRASEVAVRMSMGASRARLIRQFLTEAVLLACVGGALGLVVAVSGSRFIAALLAAGRSPVQLDVELNASVLLFALVLSLATAVAFGLVPALRATGIDLTPTLKEGGAATGLSRRRMTMTKSLVVAQIALCALVISIAGLLTRTVVNLKRFDTGLAHDGMLLFSVEPSMRNGQERLAFYDEARRRLRTLPGVGIVAYSARSPFDFSENRRPVVVPDAPSTPREGVSENIVSPEFFDLFGRRLLRGRVLTANDLPTRDAVAVINATMARRFFGDLDPLGRSILLGADKHRLTVVGVVDDARETQVREEPLPTAYTAIAQSPVDADGGGGIPRRVTVAMRTTGDPLAQAVSVRRQIHALNREAVLTYVRTMEQQLDASIVREQMLARVSGAFSLLAVLLAAVGVVRNDVIWRRAPYARDRPAHSTRGESLVDALAHHRRHDDACGDRYCDRAGRGARRGSAGVGVSVRAFAARSYDVGGGGWDPVGDRLRCRVLPGAEGGGSGSDAGVAGGIAVTAPRP
jgi:predicted permease